MANPYVYRGSSMTDEEWTGAIQVAENHKNSNDEALRALSRAFLHLRVCYDEMVKINDPFRRRVVTPKLCKGCAYHHLSIPIESSIVYHYCRHPNATLPRIEENLVVGDYEVPPPLLEQQCEYQRKDGSCGPEGNNWQEAPPKKTLLQRLFAKDDFEA